MKNSLIKSIIDAGKRRHLDPIGLLAIFEVETGGEGFDQKTGKLMIQFEPHWFRRKEPYAPSGAWSLNKVEVQSREWPAFNDAFKIDANSAMESTSIGLGQIMGFHYARLGFCSVGAFWDDAKRSIDNQIEHVIKFLETDADLIKAFKEKNWDKIATIYNGKDYKKMAKKWGREPYNISMEKAYNKYAKIYKNL